MKRYLIGSALALLFVCGCSTPPATVVKEDKSNQVDMTVELEHSNTDFVNSNINIKRRDGQTTETVKNTEGGGSLKTRLKFYPGVEEPYEREEIYNHVRYGWSRTVEKLNADGTPSLVKSWQAAKEGDTEWLYRHAIYLPGKKLQWQEIYDSSGRVTQRSQRRPDGGLDHKLFYINHLKQPQPYLLRENAEGHLAERFDYRNGDEDSPLHEYNKWAGDGKHRQLEWRRWFDNGTLEVEMTCKVQPNGKDLRHYRWYRPDGTLRRVQHFVDNYTANGDGCYTLEEYYRPDGKSIYQSRIADAEKSTTSYMRRAGGVGMIETRMRAGGTVYSWLDEQGHLSRMLEYKLVKQTDYDGKIRDTSQLVKMELYTAGKLSQRYLPHPQNNWRVGELQVFGNGVLQQRKLFSKEGFLLRDETLDATGKVTAFQDFDEEEQEPSGLPQDVFSHPEWTEGETDPLFP